MTGLELLILLFQRAGDVNTIRELLLEPAVAKEAAGTIALVSQETAGRLLREVPSESQEEQEETFRQVGLLLEVAATADEHAKQPDITGMQERVERLIWLAVIYQILGQPTKAQHRVQRARETLPEIKKLMDWDVEVANGFPCTRTEQYFPFSPYSHTTDRQAIIRSRHEETLTGLAHACMQVEHLTP